MKTALRFLLPATAILMTSCSSVKRQSTTSAAASDGGMAPGRGEMAAGKSAKNPSSGVFVEGSDEYATGDVRDPLEGMNRATFWFNDKLYTVFFRPVSKGYEKALPRFVRKGIDNVFDNVRYPQRFVNCLLQGKFKRAGKETEKLLVNTVLGLGGILRTSDRIESLKDIPAEDTGQTLGAWGIGHGMYVVLPVFGPSSVREGFGLAGDYALNPVNWGAAWSGNHDWTMAVQGAHTIRALPDQISQYDAATQDALDPYISVRSAYIQNRAEAARK